MHDINSIQMTWTETYDVLKYFIYKSKSIFYILEPKHMMYWNAKKIWNFSWWDSLNRNIWCIEIRHLNQDIYLITQLEPKHMMYWNLSLYIRVNSSKFLNRNIWCIEILINARYKLNTSETWTETYDVLK